MATKEAHSKANIEYNKRQDNIMIRPPKEMGAKIREAAAAENMSVQGYILQTLYAKIGITPGGVVKNTESEPLTEEKPSCSISPSLKRAIKKSIQDAVQNFSEEEYDKLRYELDKLIYESFIEETRKPKKVSPATDSILKTSSMRSNDPDDQTENEEKHEPPFVCKNLL